jgi:ankyrin repeat protein
MAHSLTFLRQQAKKLRKAVQAGEPEALKRVSRFLDASSDALKHADYLYVIAREEGHESWPKLKFAIEQADMDFQQKASRLEQALYHGQGWIIDALLAEAPDLAHANLGIECALYDVEAVGRRLAANPDLASQPINGRTPILHLVFSKQFLRLNDHTAMIEVANVLKDAGANVDDSYPFEGDEASPLSALYGALGHAGNIELARWLLEHGANPNDNESLYHATELDNLDGLKLMLEFGARIDGTNALARMLDFDNIEGVLLLLEAGADPNEGAQEHPSGEPSYAISSLHHAARRRCSAEIAQLLLQHGAKGQVLQFGHSAYALARMYGNVDFAKVLEQAGEATQLSANEELIARAMEGDVSGRLDRDSLSDEQRRLLCRLVAFEDVLPAVKRLIAIGLDSDEIEEMGMPAIHIAGWEGHADAMAFLLGLSPDLSRKNHYGGDLMGTILHGAENCPAAAARSHMRCVDLALEVGMPLHRHDVEHCAVPELREHLTQWAAEHPERVV